jgi:hypothetical protein
MRNFALALALFAFTGASAFAAAPTAEQKAEFYQVCVGISSDEALCSCKADAAVKLIDDKFMALVIAAMKGTKNPPADQHAAYNAYVAKSNQVCKPNY